MYNKGNWWYKIGRVTNRRVMVIQYGMRDTKKKVFAVQIDKWNWKLIIELKINDDLRLLQMKSVKIELKKEYFFLLFHLACKLDG